MANEEDEDMYKCAFCWWGAHTSIWSELNTNPFGRTTGQKEVALIVNPGSKPETDDNFSELQEISEEHRTGGRRSVFLWNKNSWEAIS